MKDLSKAILPALIASVLAGNVLAQEDKNQKCVELEGAPPGLYATTDEGRTFLSASPNRRRSWTGPAPPRQRKAGCSTPTRSKTFPKETS